ncbi:MAG: FAD-dependent oxidoreductase [Myxococcaceae bacterium]|nr:FAD-dependent oxidoreductase [Myxococcaceae bacterium]
MTPSLPPHLHERTAGSKEPRPGGAWVIYWLRTAVRAEENPALDVALLLGAQLKLPVFVYHALDERYPYASDRHHTFVLEGARDLARRLAGRGIGHTFHLARPGHRGPHLVTLAARAAAVVTEDVPLPPWQRWADEVERRSGAPVLRVDTACVVPFRQVGRAYDRAFAYRDATRALFEERVARAWVDVEPHGPAFLPDLPFEPVDLGRAVLPALVAECEIDHAVGPVPHTPGGTTAGLGRWHHFRDTALAHYAEARSSPLESAGASRLSAYLHYGMVSALAVAREAAAHRTDGARKFLDELQVWRELPWSFCAFHEGFDSLAALPAWARATLAAHEKDPRTVLSPERLERAQSEDPFWDAMQRSLLVHGELHNQVRMTWGKALLSWTRDAAAALALLIELNHRYALDGRDPASYGGIAWCLGGFDRPHLPETPVLGSVRSRPTAVYGARFDVADYARRVSRPVRGRVEQVAVVGAGIAGLALARALTDAGHAVTLFDKGRGPGGRLSTRRGELGAFDHGAQYFTARDERFARHVRRWAQEGHVAKWSPRLATLGPPREPNRPERAVRWVGAPSMSAVVAHLAASADARFGVEVTEVRRTGGAWELFAGEQGLGRFSQLAVAVPGPQAAKLLGEAAPALAAEAGRLEFAPCFAVMATFTEPLGLSFDAAFVNEGPLSWVAREASKPGRAAGERWVLHASAEWSRAHLELEPAQAVGPLLEAFTVAAKVSVAAPRSALAHRWRHARVTAVHEARCAFDPELQAGVCGDGFGGARIEAAFLSGQALAGRFLALPAVEDATPVPLEGFARAAPLALW